MFKFMNARVHRKLTVMCLILAILICCASCVAGFVRFRDATYATYNSFAYEIGEIALSCVDTDKIAEYLEEPYYDAETGEFTPDEDYETMAENIHQIYVNTSMHTYNSGIYICVPHNDSEGEYTLTNIFDVRIMEVDDDMKQYYDLGVVDNMGVDNPDVVMDIFYSGERSSDYFVHESKFGYNSTAIIPVKNSDGETVALLMSDMPMPFITETLNDFLMVTILATAVIVLLFIGVFLLVIRQTVTQPLHVIAEEADNFTNSDIKISERLSTITKSDEIGQLAHSVLEMETDIQSYVENLTAVTAEKERIGAELTIATQIQSSMLPCMFPAFPNRKEIDIYATMNPAKEVGGDFYDFFMVDDRHLAIVMADVSGKGVPAALFMVIGKTLIKDHTMPGRDLSDVFTTVNNLLCDANSEGLFITAFEGVLDLVTGEFSYVNAGHEMPYVYKKETGYVPQKIRPGFVLAGMEDMRYKPGTLTLEPGDKLFQYTDGVTEATNANNELYGMDRLTAILNRKAESSPAELLPAVKADIDAFVGEAPQFDDITMLCLEYKERMPEEK